MSPANAAARSRSAGRTSGSRPARTNGPPRTAGASGRLAARLRAFERYFARVLPKETLPPRRLHAAMRYGALSPGKRLRPLLTLAACEAAGGDWRAALPAAAAVECVHAFSLVHDDLPAMDDDDYRRGRLTTHKKFGEAMGILAGDALLALAFEELVKLRARGVRADRVARAVGILAAASGSRQLVGGQVLDLEAEGRAAGEDQVVAIHVRKTAALIRAALMLGGLAGGAREAALERLGSIGLMLGLAFQIHDDLLDRNASLARLGKRPGADEKRSKATYPRAVGEPRARASAEALMQGALDAIDELGPRARGLHALVEAIAVRDR